ncbi:MAG: hypothetical protein Q4C71_05440, partial [Microbacteriaceae bacterium]|nr:hypothetical protein [Microbacteriaceae bacterium]
MVAPQLPDTTPSAHADWDSSKDYIDDSDRGTFGGNSHNSWNPGTQYAPNAEWDGPDGDKSDPEWRRRPVLGTVYNWTGDSRYGSLGGALFGGDNLKEQNQITSRIKIYPSTSETLKRADGAKYGHLTKTKLVRDDATGKMVEVPEDRINADHAGKTRVRMTIYFNWNLEFYHQRHDMLVLPKGMRIEEQSCGNNCTYQLRRRVSNLKNEHAYTNNRDSVPARETDFHKEHDKNNPEANAGAYKPIQSGGKNAEYLKVDGGQGDGYFHSPSNTREKYVYNTNQNEFNNHFEGGSIFNSVWSGVPDQDPVYRKALELRNNGDYQYILNDLSNLDGGLRIARWDFDLLLDEGVVLQDRYLSAAVRGETPTSPGSHRRTVATIGAFDYDGDGYTDWEEENLPSCSRKPAWRDRSCKPDPDITKHLKVDNLTIYADTTAKTGAPESTLKRAIGTRYAFAVKTGIDGNAQTPLKAVDPPAGAEWVEDPASQDKNVYTKMVFKNGTPDDTTDDITVTIDSVTGEVRATSGEIDPKTGKVKSKTGIHGLDHGLSSIPRIPVVLYKKNNRTLAEQKKPGSTKNEKRGTYELFAVARSKTDLEKPGSKLKALGMQVTVIEKNPAPKGNVTTSKMLRTDVLTKQGAKYVFGTLPNGYSAVTTAAGVNGPGKVYVNPQNGQVTYWPKDDETIDTTDKPEVIAGTETAVVNDVSFPIELETVEAGGAKKRVSAAAATFQPKPPTSKKLFWELKDAVTGETVTGEGLGVRASRTATQGSSQVCNRTSNDVNEGFSDSDAQAGLADGTYCLRFNRWGNDNTGQAYEDRQFTEPFNHPRDTAANNVATKPLPFPIKRRTVPVTWNKVDVSDTGILLQGSRWCLKATGNKADDRNTPLTMNDYKSSMPGSPNVETTGNCAGGMIINDNTDANNQDAFDKDPAAGKFKVNLPWTGDLSANDNRSFTLTEIAAPSGFVLDNTANTIRVRKVTKTGNDGNPADTHFEFKRGQTTLSSNQPAQITNTRAGRLLQIQTTDQVYRVLGFRKDSRIQIFKRTANGGKGEEVTGGAIRNGLFKLDNLPDGRYIANVTADNAAYDATPFDVEINHNEQTTIHTIPLKRKKGMLTFNKTTDSPALNGNNENIGGSKWCVMPPHPNGAGWTNVPRKQPAKTDFTANSLNISPVSNDAGCNGGLLVEDNGTLDLDRAPGQFSVALPWLNDSDQGLRYTIQEHTAPANHEISAKKYRFDVRTVNGNYAAAFDPAAPAQNISAWPAGSKHVNKRIIPMKWNVIDLVAGANPNDSVGPETGNWGYGVDVYPADAQGNCIRNEALKKSAEEAAAGLTKGNYCLKYNPWRRTSGFDVPLEKDVHAGGFEDSWELGSVKF